MKKLLVVLLTLTCLAAAAFADMAPTALSVSGEVTYGIIANGNTSHDGWPNGYVNFTATADKYNSAVLGLSWWNDAIPLTQNNPGMTITFPNIELAYVKSDIGGAMGVADMADPVMYAGWGVYEMPSFAVTQYASERLAAIGIDGKGNSGGAGAFGAENGGAWGLVALDTKLAGLVNVVLATDGNLAYHTTPGPYGQELIGLYGNVSGIGFEAAYATKQTKSGFVPLGLKYATSMGDIALTVMGQYVYNANSSSDDLTYNGKSTWSVGAKAVYQGMYTVDAALMSYVVTNGASSNVGNTELKLTGDLMVNLSPTVGIVASPWFNFDSAAKDAFDALEAFVWVKAGIGIVRIGYFYTSSDITDLKTGVDYAPSTNEGEGGVWVTLDLTF